jgi:hypothetical protein
MVRTVSAVVGLIGLAGCATGGLPLPETADPGDAGIWREPSARPERHRGGGTCAGPRGRDRRGAMSAVQPLLLGGVRESGAVAVPDLGRAAPVVQVSCTAEGLRGEASVGPDFRAGGYSGYGGGTTIGVGVAPERDVAVGIGTFWSPWGWGGGGVGAYGPVRVRYPEVRVQMR